MTGNSTDVAEPLVNPMAHVWGRRCDAGTVTQLIAHVWGWTWERAQVAQQELLVLGSTSGCGELDRVALVYHMLLKPSVSGVRRGVPEGYVRVVYPRVLAGCVVEFRRWVSAQVDLVGAWKGLVQERWVARPERRRCRRGWVSL